MPSFGPCLHLDIMLEYNVQQGWETGMCVECGQLGVHIWSTCLSSRHTPHQPCFTLSSSVCACLASALELGGCLLLSQMEDGDMCLWKLMTFTWMENRVPYKSKHHCLISSLWPGPLFPLFPGQSHFILESYARGNVAHGTKKRFRTPEFNYMNQLSPQLSSRPSLCSFQSLDLVFGYFCFRLTVCYVIWTWNCCYR